MDHWNGPAIDQRRKWRLCRPSLVKAQTKPPNKEQGWSPRSGSAAHRCLLYTSPSICGTPSSGIGLPHRKMADISIRGNAMQIHLAGKSGLNRYTQLLTVFILLAWNILVQNYVCVLLPQTSPGRYIICSVHIILLVQIPRYSRFENTSAPRV